MQRCLFDLHNKVNYFGIVPTGNIGRDTPIQYHDSRYLQNESLQQLHRSLTQENEDAFSKSEVKAQIQKQISPFLESKRVNLLSNERFLSVFFSYPNLEAKAHRLKLLVPNAQILIVIRNQADIISSQYRDWPFDPRNLTGGAPVSIGRWVDLALEHDEEIGFLRSLQYDRIVDLYEDLFGAEAVSVFCLEQLASDASSFAEDIASCLQIDATQTQTLLRGCHENKGVTRKRNLYRHLKRTYPVGRIETLLQRFDRVMGSALKDRLDTFLDTGPKASYTIPPPQARKVRDVFSQSNHSLEQSRGLPLSEYKYPQ
ncbi:hypothetical protein GGP43_003075 [Salinibacter ruber]|nr:hypothetical protein [Salinibacter ruber]